MKAAKLAKRQARVNSQPLEYRVNKALSCLFDCASSHSFYTDRTILGQKHHEDFSYFDRLETLFEQCKDHPYSSWILEIIRQKDWEKFNTYEHPLARFVYCKSRFFSHIYQDKMLELAKNGCVWSKIEYLINKKFSYTETTVKFYERFLQQEVEKNNPFAVYSLGILLQDVELVKKAGKMGWLTSMQVIEKKCLSTNDMASFSELCIKKDNCRIDNYQRLKKHPYWMGKCIYWSEEIEKKAERSELCFIDYYCDCIDIQQQSLWLFLWYWSCVLKFPKVVGRLIGQLVWNQREENLILKFKK